MNIFFTHIFITVVYIAIILFCWLAGKYVVPFYVLWKCACEKNKKRKHCIGTEMLCVNEYLFVICLIDNSELRISELFSWKGLSRFILLALSLWMFDSEVWKYTICKVICYYLLSPALFNHVFVFRYFLLVFSVVNSRGKYVVLAYYYSWILQW